MTKINLRNKRLQTLPQNIQKDVNFLDISLNEIETIPSTYSSLSLLTKINISYNKFTSFQSLGKLKSLITIENMMNPIEVIDKSLNKLTNLKSLNCNKNKIQTISEGFCIQEVTSISFEMNFISELPLSFGLMNNLKQLSLAGNCLHDFPLAIVELHQLVYLNLDYNSLKSIPENINQLSNLINCQLNDNEITIIPKSLFEISSLKTIQLNKNKIVTIPNINSQNQCIVEEFLINDNHISIIPQSITNMKYLKNFQCENNNITELPHLDQLTQLTFLNISNNSCSSIKSMPSSLKKLYLPYNELTEIKIELPTSLVELLVDFNKLISVPEISELKNLKVFDVSSNQISHIPKDFSALSSLTYFNITDNVLGLCVDINTSKIPLQYFNISFNHLLLLPNTLFTVTSLTSLDISENNILTIPSEISQLTHLREMTLSSNNLTTFPIPLCYLSKLQSLIISNNDIFELPLQMTLLTNLTSLDICCNNISSIKLLTSLTLLRHLDASSNCIDSIPQEITNLKNLSQCDLSLNKITTISKEFLKPNMLFNLSSNLMELSKLEDIKPNDYLFVNFENNPFKKISAAKNSNRNKMINLNKITNNFFSFTNPGALQTSNYNSNSNSNSNSEMDKILNHTLEITCARAEMCGRRPSYEDTLCIIPYFMNKRTSTFAAIYDGHSGQKVSNYVAKRLHLIVQNCLEEGMQPNEALKEGFNRVQKEIVEHKFEDGCTAVVVLMIDLKLYVAWVGDSRAVLCRGGQAIQLTEDHKPYSLHEKERIIKLGGHVFNGRVNGELAVSRSLGDVSNEPFVSSIPEVREYDLLSNDDFVILACDGIWDCVSNQKAVNIIRTSKNFNVGCIKLRDYAYHMGSQDNITCAVVTIPFCY